MYARPRIGESPTQRAYENLHFGNFQLSKSPLPLLTSLPLYSPAALSAPCSPMTNRSSRGLAAFAYRQLQIFVQCSAWIPLLRRISLSVYLSGGLSVCVSACSFVRGFSSVSFRLASKCNFLISHWGNAVKNLGLGEQADKPSRLGLRGSKVDGARIQINDPAPQTTSAKNRRQRRINA